MHILILTGVGLSIESGLWESQEPGERELLRYNAYEAPMVGESLQIKAITHKFFNLHRQIVVESKPNYAHAALSRLQAALRKSSDLVFICTENLDDLQERGSSTAVLHLNGSLLEARCTNCEETSSWTSELTECSVCPACFTNAVLRPNIAWLGESKSMRPGIMDAIEQAQFFVIIGTSGSIYPASGFAREVKRRSVPTVEINREPSENSSSFDAGLYGPLTETVPMWVEAVLALSEGDRNDPIKLKDTIVTARSFYIKQLGQCNSI